MRGLLRRFVVCPATAGALLALLLSGGCGDLLTGDGSSGRQNWAVIVGISSYQSPLLNLTWADEDALDFYDALRHGRGWETERITLLTNASATREAIKAAVAGLAKRVSADDQVVFYFAGRGAYGPDQPPYDEGDGLDEYLLPFDAQPGSSAKDLSDDEIEVLFAALPTNNVVLILDAGFAGDGSRAGLPSGKERCLVRSGRTVAPRNIDGMSHDLARPGYLFVTGAQDGAAPSESNQLRNGVFTHFFVEALSRAAAAGRKGISVQQAFEYAAPRTSSFEAGQSPRLVDNRGKSFALVSF